MHSSLSRELMLAIATAMMGYTLCVFTRVFNARMSHCLRTALWLYGPFGLRALRRSGRLWDEPWLAVLVVNSFMSNSAHLHQRDLTT